MELATLMRDEHPEMIWDYGRLKENLNLFKLDIAKPPSMECTRGYWVYGKPGLGKTTWVLKHYPDAFEKPQSKWWDGYGGELQVLLDDLDTHVLGHYIKKWTDKFPIKGEVKRGTIPLMFDKFFITSNYTPEELWKDDLIMAQAVRRRCMMFHVYEADEGIFIEDGDGVKDKIRDLPARE